MGVISAKNYARLLNCHKVLMEALERLMLACFPFGKLSNISHKKLVSRTIAAIKCFNNPFNIPDDEKLYNLLSGALVSEEVAKDVLTAETVCRLAKEDFIENRLVKKDGFFDSIKHPNLKTMAYMHKSVKLSSSQNKVVDTDMYKEDYVKGHLKDWKVFLANDENKTQFIQLLLSTWRSEVSANILTGHEMILICEGKACQLTSDGHYTFCQAVHSLKSSQEETDTHVILYCMYAKEQRCKSVCMRSPDSDIFFILLQHARFLEGLQILFETGKSNTQHCIDVTKLAMSSMLVLCSALLSHHAFTRCNSTSAFKGKGKVKGLKVVEIDESFQKAFSKLGESWEVNEEVMNELERFTCVLHGNKRTKKGEYIVVHNLASKVQ
uniref:Uncharacterized protein n=1 Tax=Octopus bimaculoides TaxID=37653 RepID=A0A0L8GQI2_OCTBM